jgi:hypothetical protein
MDFGLFNGFFTEEAHYLPFLVLREEGINKEGWGLPRSINKLRRIIRENNAPEVLSGIFSLLRERNWQMHIVAAMAALLLDKPSRQRASDELWKVIRRGSWTSPQILVVLSRTDGSFAERGRAALGDDAVGDKAKRALEYLLFHRIDETVRYDRGGEHARDWEADLENLIEQGLLSFREDAIYGGPAYFVSYYEHRIASCPKTYWIRQLADKTSNPPSWLQWLCDRISPNAFHFLRAAECAKRRRELGAQAMVTPGQYNGLLDELVAEFGKSKLVGSYNRRKIGRHHIDFRESLFPELWFVYRYWGNDLGIRPATDEELWRECPLFSKHRRSRPLLLSPAQAPIIAALCIQWLAVETKRISNGSEGRLSRLVRQIRLNRVSDVEYIDDPDRSAG